MSRAEPLSFSGPCPPVRISEAREIRTLTAIRPYRPSGFVLRRDNLGDKVIVHNYGHGGCGITLSWGCAEIAAELAAPSAGEAVAVIGGGVVGLTTARELQRRGARVTVYADQFSPYTTSDVAGALWFPVTLYDEAVATPEFLARFRQAARRSYEVFTALREEPRYGVYPMRFFELSEIVREEGWPSRVEGQDLYPQFTRISGAEAFGFPDGLRYEALMIDPSHFLPALMEDIRAAGGRLVKRKFQSAADLLTQEATVLVNCTGYGAKALFADREMIPVRGQLTLIEGQPGIDYGYSLGRGASQYLYMFPRREAIVLGGTKDVGNDSLDIDEDDRQRMLDGHARMARAIAEAAL